MKRCLIALLFPLYALCVHAEELNAVQVAHWTDGGNYADVWADGNYVFLGQFGNSFIDIIDIEDPTNPQRARRYDLPPPNHVASAQDVKTGDGLLFIGLEGLGNGVHIVDVRDPENPIPLVDVAIPGFNAIHNVFYDQGYLYMCDSSTPRFGVLDLTDFDPDNPPADPISELMWMVENVGTMFVHDITVVDGRLYACAWDSGLWIYDITQVASEAPTFLGSTSGNNTHSAWPTDDGNFVITGEERNGGGIKVYRITPGGPGLVLTQTDEVALPTSIASSVHNQIAVGYRVYNSWYGAGMRVYDVDPTDGSLKEFAVFNTTTTSSTWGIYPLLGADKVLASDISGGLTIISVGTEPTTGPDVNGDGVVDTLDMITIVNRLGPCPGGGTCLGDLNGDNTINFSDLGMLVESWPDPTSP